MRTCFMRFFAATVISLFLIACGLCNNVLGEDGLTIGIAKTPLSAAFIVAD